MQRLSCCLKSKNCHSCYTLYNYAFCRYVLTLHFTLSLSDMKTVSLLAHKHNVVINVETMVQKATSSKKEKLGDKVVSQIHLREAFCNAYISPSSCFT